MIFRRVRSLPNAFWKIPRITQIDIIAASILNKNIIGPRIMPLFEMQFKRVLSIDNRVSVTPILLIILCGVACPPKTDPFAVLGFGSKPDD